MRPGAPSAQAEAIRAAHPATAVLCVAGDVSDAALSASAFQQHMAVHGRCGRAQAYLDGEGGWVRSHTEGRTALLA